MSKFYSAESGAEVLGIQERQFCRDAKEAGVKPMLVKKQVGVSGGAAIHGFYSEKQIEQVRQYRLTGQRVNPIQVEVTIAAGRMSPREIEGFERVCFHCAHAQPDGTFRCCQCADLCSGREVGGRSRSSMVNA